MRFCVKIIDVTTLDCWHVADVNRVPKVFLAGSTTPSSLPYSHNSDRPIVLITDSLHPPCSLFETFSFPPPQSPSLLHRSPCFPLLQRKLQNKINIMFTKAVTRREKFQPTLPTIREKTGPFTVPKRKLEKWITLMQRTDTFL